VHFYKISIKTGFFSIYYAIFTKNGWLKEQLPQYILKKNAIILIPTLKSTSMNIPKALILFYLILAPILVGLAYFICDTAKITILVLMYLGLVSDIFDGIIARKQRVSNAQLRRMDSQTDMVS
jgi:hypothetical protein